MKPTIGSGTHQSKDAVGVRRRKTGLAAKLEVALRVLAVPFVRSHAYRPERHYMRGPGPKARTKSGSRAEPDKD